MSDEKVGKTEKSAPAPSEKPAGPSGMRAPAPAPAELPRVAGLEQVREILFGAIHRDLELRLARAETHVAARVHDLEQESRRRTEVLENHLKRETEALAGRVERQWAEINDGIRNLTRELRDAAAQSEKRIAKAEETNSNGLREVRHQLLEQAKQFLDELQKLRKEMLATFQRELGLEEGELIGGPSEMEGSSRH